MLLARVGVGYTVNGVLLRICHVVGAVSTDAEDIDARILVLALLTIEEIECFGLNYKPEKFHTQVACDGL